MNILIDTCSWIDLLTTKSHNKSLEHLEFWVANNHVNIVTHRIIIEEWNKNKIKERNEYFQSLKTKYNHANEVLKSEKLPLQNLEPKTYIYDNQIDIIDKILKQAIILDTPIHVKSQCMDRTLIPRKAPFHNKLYSTNDAYIIFSALDYFNSRNESFTFISSNTSDFGAPNNLDNEIHPDIICDYENTQLAFYTHLGKVIFNLKNILPCPDLVNNDSINSHPYSDEISIDRTKPIINQLEDYLISRYKEIKFIPINILIDHFPFRNVNSLRPYYSTFNLTIENKEIISLLDSFTISRDNSILFKHKTSETESNSLKFILKKLSSNLIFKISEEINPNKSYNIRFVDHKNCDCIKCKFYKLDFNSVLKAINNEDDNEDLAQRAYIHYKLGNFIQAYNCLKKLLHKADKNDQKTTKFLINFNLKKLRTFIEDRYWGNMNQDVIVEELKNIDLTIQALQLKTIENKRILDWILDLSFYYNANDKIQKKVKQIINQYYSQLNGGRSSNNHVWNLISYYAEFDAFINENYLFFDKFSEYEELFDTFVEGLIVSLGIEKPGNSKLDALDDWMLHRIILYGKAESINKYFNRYQLKNIAYNRTSIDGNSLPNLFSNFFIKNIGLDTLITNHCESNNVHLSNYFNTIFSNILTMVSICKLEDAEIKLMAEQLLEYLKGEAIIRSNNLMYVTKFIWKIKDKISNDLIVDYLFLAINNQKYHIEYIIEDFLELLTHKKIKIELTQDQFQLIKDITLGKCNFCNQKHDSSLITQFYELIDSEDLQNNIKDCIEKSLDNEFDFNLCYLSCLYDITTLTSEQLILLIDNSIPKGKGIGNSLFSDEEEEMYRAPSNLLNLCFKLQIDTKTLEFDKIRTINEYYYWLTNMETFDYSKFNPKWISYYKTKFYFKKIYESKETQNALEKFLVNKDSKIESDYINIFIIKTWNTSDAL